MEFLLSMSILSSAADISREKGRAQEWMTAWVARNDDRRGAATEQGKPQQSNKASPAQVPREPQQKKVQARPHFALEFDGLNCFETFVSH